MRRALESQWSSKSEVAGVMVSLALARRVVMSSLIEVECSLSYRFRIKW